MTGVRVVFPFAGLQRRAEKNAAASAWNEQVLPQFRSETLANAPDVCVSVHELGEECPRCEAADLAVEAMWEAERALEQHAREVAQQSLGDGSGLCAADVFDDSDLVTMVAARTREAEAEVAANAEEVEP